MTTSFIPNPLNDGILGSELNGQLNSKRSPD